MKAIERMKPFHASAGERTSITGKTDDSFAGQARDVLERLRSLVTASAPSSENGGTTASRNAARPERSFENILQEINDSLDRLSTEHAGMVRELLSVYEQLGVVFEVTRKLADAGNETEVVDLFVDCLRRSFEARQVFAYLPAPGSASGSSAARRPGGDAASGQPLYPGASWRQRRGTKESQNYLSALVERACREKSVVVDRPPLGAAPPMVAEVMVGPMFAGEAFVSAIVLTRAQETEPFHASDMLLLDAMTHFCGDLIRTTRLVRELREMSISVVRTLVSAVDQKDEYTSGHSVRVAYYAMLLGKALELAEHDLNMLQWSALLHDVGKIGIRDEVLKKQGKLEPHEFDHIKEHPKRSYHVVREVSQLSGALDGVLYHHERYDGTGYPHGLSGEAIPLQARIIQIADIFDALTSDRSYRPAFTWQEALDILAEEAGRTVDPTLQPVFDRLMRNALQHSPGAWQEMIREAERFARRENGEW